jgi:hypothetical protein
MQIIPVVFLISNSRRVLNVVCFFLGNSSASEFYMPTFRNTLFHLHRRIGKRFSSKIAWAYIRLWLFSSQTFSRRNTPTFSNPVILHTYPPMKMEQTVPKRRHIKFRRRRITQKKAYNIPVALWTKWPILSSRSEVASVIQGVRFILSPTMEALSHRKSEDMRTSRDTYRAQGHALTVPSQRGFPFHE